MAFFMAGVVRAHELKVARVCVHDQAGTCWISSSSTDRRLCSTSLDPASFLRVRAEFKFNTRMIRTRHLVKSNKTCFWSARMARMRDVPTPLYECLQGNPRQSR